MLKAASFSLFVALAIGCSSPRVFPCTSASQCKSGNICCVHHAAAGDYTECALAAACPPSITADGETTHTCDADANCSDTPISAGVTAAGKCCLLPENQIYSCEKMCPKLN